MSINVYQIVTDRIIAELEKGRIPWLKPWSGYGSEQTVAINYVSRKPYSLLNQMLLIHRGEYLTFKQVTDAGGRVKKGAKAEMVVFFKMLPVKDKEEDERTIPFLRYYNVFHISQTEGVESKLPSVEAELPKTDAELDEDAENMAHSYIDREGITFYQRPSDVAYYCGSDDSIVLPIREQFADMSKYYSTVFHEIAHSTGHENRLNRKGIGVGRRTKSADELYSMEELIAEISAACILNKIGIETTDSIQNNVAYVQSWIKHLQDDPKMIVSAAGRAEKAVKYIEGGAAEAENKTEAAA